MKLDICFLGLSYEIFFGVIENLSDKDILFGIIGCEDEIFYYWQNNIYTLVDRANILPLLEFLIPKLILFS